MTRFSTAAADQIAAGVHLAQALDRLRQSLGPPPEPAAVVASAPAAPPASGPTLSDLSDLTRRLDDAGCAFGRVSAARVEGLTRGYERLETKLNAVLLAVTGTFVSTLASLLLYYARGGGH
ncbi:MAG: hypothetical protein U0821_19815 [Chloroflexota bacterium]